MTARRMATASNDTSPKAVSVTSSYGTANPEQLYKAQIGLEINTNANKAQTHSRVQQSNVYNKAIIEYFSNISHS